MDVGVDSYSYHRLFGLRRPNESPGPRSTVRWDLQDLLAEADRIKAEAVAVQTMFISSPGRFVADLKATGSPIEHPILSWGGGEGLRYGDDPDAQADLEGWMVAAAACNLDLVRIVVGGPRLRGIRPIESVARSLVPGLRRIAVLARTLGLTIAVENHGDLRSDELHRILDLVDFDDELGLCLDVANLVRLGENPPDAVREAASRIRMVHLRDCEGITESTDFIAGPEVRPFGAGEVPISATLAVMEEWCPNVPVLVELAQLGPGVDECCLVETSLQWLRGWRARAEIAVGSKVRGVHGQTPQRRSR